MNSGKCSTANCKYVHVDKAEATRNNLMPPSPKARGKGKGDAAAALEDNAPAAPAIEWGGPIEDSDEENDDKSIDVEVVHSWSAEEWNALVARASSWSSGQQQRDRPEIGEGSPNVQENTASGSAPAIEHTAPTQSETAKTSPADDETTVCCCPHAVRRGEGHCRNLLRCDYTSDALPLCSMCYDDNDFQQCVCVCATALRAGPTTGQQVRRMSQRNGSGLAVERCGQRPTIRLPRERASSRLLEPINQRHTVLARSRNHNWWDQNAQAGGRSGHGRTTMSRKKGRRYVLPEVD